MPITIKSGEAVPVNAPPEAEGVLKIVTNSLSRNDQLKKRKIPWEDQWQLVGEFIHMMKQEFQSQHTVGEFLTREIFDSTGPKAAKTAASTLISMLWPQTKNRMKMLPPHLLKGTDAEKEYYEFMTRTVLQVMDDPKSGFNLATDEYMLDQVTFGTSGVEIVSDPETKVRYTPWGVRHMAIDEGQNGIVDTIYIEVMRSNQRLVKDYGIENVSQKTREEFNDGKLDLEKKLLIAIEPRITKIQGKAGNKNKPFSSLTIEIEAKHLIKESGFDEMPIKVTRFVKLLGEVYGRSLAMDALPVILERNTTKEATIVAVEKSLDPPLGMYSDGGLGGGEVDTSAGAINVFNPADQAKDRQPIFELFTVGEFGPISSLLKDQAEEISNHFLIDRLLDFNNETRMTATETTLRDRMRSATLGQIFNRQMAEYFIPSIERTVNVLRADNRLGVRKDSPEDNGFRPIIPDTVVALMDSGEDVFTLEFFTPAKRIMQSEEAEGILRAVELAERFVGMDEREILDNIDPDITFERYSDIIGAPSEMRRSKEAIKKRRADRLQDQNDARSQENIAAQSEAMRNAGQSGLMNTQAPRKAE